MDFRKASLCSLAFTFLVGVLFFYLSFDMPASARGVVIGAGYYPRLFSGLIIVASVVGFITNYRNRAMSSVSVGIPRPRYFFFVLFLGIVLTFVWQMTGRFYPICAIVVPAMLWFLNPEPASAGKAIKTALVTVGLMGFIYGIFGVLLQLSL